MIFPAVVYECEIWTIKKAVHQRNDAFELWCWRKLFESLLDCKEIKPINPKGNQPWIFIRRTEAEAPILWPPNRKSWLTGKAPDEGKDWGQKEKGVTKDEIVGWHHQLDRHECEQDPRDGEGQGSLVCWVHGVTKTGWDRTEWLNNSESFQIVHFNSHLNTNSNQEPGRLYQGNIAIERNTTKFTVPNY